MSFRQIFFAATLTLPALGFAEPPEDVKGWNGTSWGDTIGEVREKIDAEIVRLPPDEQIHNVDSVKQYGIKRFEAAGIQFEVNFWTDPREENELYAVRLDGLEIGGGFVPKPNDLIAALRNKYGKPDEKKESNKWEEWFWYFPSTTIQLRHVPSGTMTGVFVHYEEAADSEGL